MDYHSECLLPSANNITINRISNLDPTSINLSFDSTQFQKNQKLKLNEVLHETATVRYVAITPGSVLPDGAGYVQFAFFIAGTPYTIDCSNSTNEDKSKVDISN